ncbi:MAG: DMT family transporter [Chthoniobacterales bacterium]
MKPARIFSLTVLAMLCFAGNSLLCRLALRNSLIDAASFTSIRLISGAVLLFVIATFRSQRPLQGGSWFSAFALFSYAAAFSFAYISLPAGTGALLLFGAVQSTMIFWGLRRGESFGWSQVFGLIVALAGLVALVLPGLASPPLRGSMLMITAGVAWGVYSLRGKRGGDAASSTAGNFIRVIPFAVVLTVAFSGRVHADHVGLICALLSGAITSGIGYVLWYAVLPSLASTSAGTVQLSVPVLAAVGGITLLGEQPTLRFVLASVAVLSGIAIVIWNQHATTTRSRA